LGDLLYDEREQTKAKHDLLRRYLERFAYKILHGYGAADFIDGFSGPWENKDRTRFRDTSFGIALETLNTAAANLAEQGKPARVRCIFNEKDTAAAKDLADFVERVRPEFPHVEIHSLTGSFEDNAPRIDRLATHPFRLVFVDPTGWTGYPLDALKTVCQRRCELILNFMHEHIQRHLYHPSEDRERWLRAIVGDGIAAEFAGRELPAEDIRAAVLRMFKTELRFVYACHSPIEMVEKRRLHFSMIYGTSAAQGVFALRDAEKKALSEHEQTVENRRSRGQLSLFSDTEQPAGPYGALRRQHLADLPQLVAELARKTKDTCPFFENFAAVLMESHFVTAPEIKKEISALAKQRLIEPNWKVRKPKARGPDNADNIVWIADGIT
jgi:three-Cys-motif partner protein